MPSDSQPYRIVVLGANGGIGRQAVQCALSAGHAVTAILRTPAKLPLAHPNLRVMPGDVLKPETLREPLAGADVVISAIGRNSLRKTTLYSQGSENLLAAMAAAGVRRVFFVSASGLEVNPTHPFLIRFATRFLLQVILRNMYADLWRMEGIVKNSAADWTIIRPPQLVDAPETGIYRTAVDHFLPNALKISRADVAHFAVHNLFDEAYFQKTVEVAY